MQGLPAFRPVLRDAGKNTRRRISGADTRRVANKCRAADLLVAGLGPVFPERLIPLSFWNNNNYGSSSYDSPFVSRKISTNRARHHHCHETERCRSQLSYPSMCRRPTLILISSQAPTNPRTQSYCEYCPCSAQVWHAP